MMTVSRILRAVTGTVAALALAPVAGADSSRTVEAFSNSDFSVSMPLAASARSSRSYR